MKIKLTIFLLILILITTTGFSCSKTDPQAQQALSEKIELNIWGLYDSSDVFKQIIASYQLLHPNVKIKYTKLRWEEYEEQLVNAWAEGLGPDIFILHNTWIGKYQNKILPLPEKISLPFVEKAGIGKQATAIIKTISTPNPYQIKNLFPDVVAQDVIRNNQIYGLPLSIDTLALFYNRDHLNAAGIANPPQTWQELIDITPQLTLQDENGEIVRSAVSLGGADNINRSNDILSLLMLQNGTQMTNERNSITFDKESFYKKNYYPGKEALKFYTDFASPAKQVYTWNRDLAEALDLFANGKLSLMFGYSYQIPALRAQAPKINFGIAPMLHINADGTDAFNLPINFASYWCYSVFKNSPHPNYAWDFINFMATQSYQNETGQTQYYVEDYLNQTSRPPALKNLISKYNNLSPETSVFNNQILTAQSWYRGQYPDNMNLIFKQMINHVLFGKTDVAKALSSAARALSENY